MIFNLDFTPLSETDSKGLFFQNLFFGVGLLGVFIALILIGGVIILILDSDKYHFNLAQL